MKPHAPQLGPQELSRRIRGCLLGGSLGDTLGGRYEGLSPPLDVIWGPPWSLSDDTQLTLATCEAIIENGRPDPETIAAAMARWHIDGRVTGLGAATRGALDALVRGGHWALVGRRGEMAAGNGAAMRIAPLAFFVDPDELEGRQLIRDVARITHHSEEAYVGALAIVIAMRAALLGAWTGGDGLLRHVLEQLPDSRVRDRLCEVEEDKPSTVVECAQRFGCSGYVVESVPLVLFAAQMLGALGFHETLSSIVEAGGDTDTNAAMAGQVMGCLIGVDDLLDERTSEVPDMQAILDVGEHLAGVLQCP